MHDITDGQTDRQTDRRTDGHNRVLVLRVSASRSAREAKNQNGHILPPWPCEASRALVGPVSDLFCYFSRPSLIFFGSVEEKKFGLFCNDSVSDMIKYFDSALSMK